MPKIEYRFDPFELAELDFDPDLIPRAKREELLEEISDFVTDAIREDCENRKSPVDGSAFPKLSADYKKKKQAMGGAGVPDLELTGDMLNGMRTKTAKGEIAVYISGKQNQLKADNHNKFSPESKDTPVPARKFIPNSEEDETFRPAIVRGIKKIIRDFIEDEA
jgi:hypothetical protein